MRKLFFIGVLVVMSAVLVGWGSYNSRIPNGNVYSCSTCHGSDYSLNSFGFYFQLEGDRWTYDLSQMDSVVGGAANGEELLDPDGEWEEGDADPDDPADVTNPGYPNDDEGDVKKHPGAG